MAGNSKSAAEPGCADEGRRLDHVWVGPALGNAVAATEVMREARGWGRPSDHVPVRVTLSL